MDLRLTLLQLLVVSVFISSCTNEGTEIKSEKSVENHDVLLETEITQPELDENSELIEYRKQAIKAIETGDTLIYNNVSSWYIRSRNPENLLFFANLMSKKHDYHRAYYDIYFIHNNVYKVCNEDDMALVNYIYYNLAKANELGHTIRFENILGKDISSENIGHSEDYLCR